MIGVSADCAPLPDQLGRLDSRPASACGRPSGSARTSRSATARSAARPESASTTGWPSGASIARSAMRLTGVVVDDEDRRRGRRGVGRCDGGGRPAISRAASGGRSTARRPAASRRGRRAARAVSTGLGMYAEAPASMQRWRSPASTFAVNATSGSSSPDGQLAHRAHRRVAIHARHHDVDEHEVDVRRLLQERDALLAALRRDRPRRRTRSSSAVRAKMLRKSSSTTSTFMPAMPSPAGDRGAASGSSAGPAIAASGRASTRARLRRIAVCVSRPARACRRAPLRADPIVATAARAFGGMGAATGSHSPRTASSSAVSTGLGTYAEAPASMQRWRSPVATFAVNATSGSSLALRQLAHRSHRRVAVHARHHDVHEHDVDVRRSARAARRACSPLSAETTSTLTRFRSAARAKMLRNRRPRPSPSCPPVRARRVLDGGQRLQRGVSAASSRRRGVRWAPACEARASGAESGGGAPGAEPERPSSARRRSACAEAPVGADGRLAGERRSASPSSCRGRYTVKVLPSSGRAARG